MKTLRGAAVKGVIYVTCPKCNERYKLYDIVQETVIPKCSYCTDWAEIYIKRRKEK